MGESQTTWCLQRLWRCVRGWETELQTEHSVQHIGVMCNTFPDKLQQAPAPGVPAACARMSGPRGIIVLVCAPRHSLGLVGSLVRSLDVPQNWWSVLVTIVLGAGNSGCQGCSCSVQEADTEGRLLLVTASRWVDRVALRKSQDYLGFCHLTSPFPSAHPCALPWLDLILLGEFLLFLDF